MKTACTLLICVMIHLAASCPVSAQETPVASARWMFGISFSERAGEGAVSFVDKSVTIRYADHPFIMLGAAAVYSLSDDLRIQGELHYNLWEQALPELTYDQLPPSSITREAFQFADVTVGTTGLLDIPILLSWRLPTGTLPLRLLAGPMLGVAQDGAGQVHLYVFHDDQPRDISIEELRQGDIAPLWFGMEAGLQLETALSSHFAIQTDIRYQHQFTPLIDEDFVTWSIPDALRLRLAVMVRM
ncbi:MAG: hypothetical protein IH600_00885 [Bacteroidetes bacterium]|nr:hypothetical protein [Bacteroidota bacterium]